MIKSCLKRICYADKTGILFIGTPCFMCCNLLMSCAHGCVCVCMCVYVYVITNILNYENVSVISIVPVHLYPSPPLSLLFPRFCHLQPGSPAPSYAPVFTPQCIFTFLVHLMVRFSSGQSFFYHLFIIWNKKEKCTCISFSISVNILKIIILLTNISYAT